jgi:hypothetical protein
MGWLSGGCVRSGKGRAAAQSVRRRCTGRVLEENLQKATCLASGRRQLKRLLRRLLTVHVRSFLRAGARSKVHPESTVTWAAAVDA